MIIHRELEWFVREKLTWYSLAVDINKIIEKYDTNEIEKEYGKKSRRSVINALKYPKLDEKIIAFIDDLGIELVDDDFYIQNEIQFVAEASKTSVIKAPNRPIVTDNFSRGKIIRRDPRLTKTAIVNANYLCEV